MTQFPQRDYGPSLLTWGRNDRIKMTTRHLFTLVTAGAVTKKKKMTKTTSAAIENPVEIRKCVYQSKITASQHIKFLLRFVRLKSNV